MQSESMELAQLLTPAFFNQGAFLSDFETDEVLLGIGGEVRQVQNPQFSEAIFYLKDFFTNHYLVYFPQKLIKTTRSEILKAVEKISTTIEIKESKNEDALYAQDFEKLKSSWSEDLKKVVLISREEYKIQDSQTTKLHLFKKAFEFGTGLPYGLFTPSYGVIGSTPELLYKMKSTELKTFALAGTSQKGHETHLLESKKDRLEHELVIKDIKEKLSSFSKEISVGDTHILNYKNMIHLKTDIRAMVNENLDAIALTSIMSPTAALGGYPKLNSLQFLKDSQYQAKHPKRYFGSAFGTMNTDLNEAVVSIRNVQWNNETFYIESGGGVLPASELQKELDEIALKRSTVRKHYL